ncbi:MAG: glycosyltransferase family 1 protein [Chloroflexi bacterium]|nr:MAG: glycosyltransferase family 1 protein [Chloroflexota bacterium]
MGATRRLKVGIYFNARRQQGGLYQYALTLVDCLYRYVPEFDYRLYHATLEELPLQTPGENWHRVNLSGRAIKTRLLAEAVLLSAARLGIRIPFSLIPEFAEIRNDHLDVMIYVKPGVHPFQWKYKTIFPIHDLQHRLQPEFPEVSQNGEYQRREYFYIRSIAMAPTILTDSETGKEDVLDCYKVNGEQIFVLPYIAPTFRSSQTTPEVLAHVRRKYSLPDQYLFYPAAFWKHKNHARLIHAIAILANERNVRIPLVLVGNKHGEYDGLVSLANSLGLHDIVNFIGYVPDDDMAALYHQALALVMPTFFGPTNIPILEAWMAECAVITSDLRGIREQVGDAGLLANPTSERAIATAIWSLSESPRLRHELIERGKSRAAQWTPQKFAQRLADAIQYTVTN